MRSLHLFGEIPTNFFRNFYAGLQAPKRFVKNRIVFQVRSPSRNSAGTLCSKVALISCARRYFTITFIVQSFHSASHHWQASRMQVSRIKGQNRTLLIIHYLSLQDYNAFLLSRYSVTAPFPASRKARATPAGPSLIPPNSLETIRT